MDFALRLEQPNVLDPGASRRFAFGPSGAPLFALLNGRASNYEGGADEMALSLKWLPEGEAEYRSERRTYRLAGSIQLLLNRGQPYRMRMKGRSESFVVFFPREATDAAWQAHTGEATGMPEVPSAAALHPVLLQSHLFRLREECRSDDPDGEALIELSSVILGEVVALAQTRRGQAARLPALRQTTRDELLRRVLRAEDYLLSGSKPTLSGAARAAALSPFHLIRAFGAVFGETPLAYATARKLEHAYANLRDTNFSIGEIALAAGYESRNAFDRAFAKRFGRTPGAARAAA